VNIKVVVYCILSFSCQTRFSLLSLVKAALTKHHSPKLSQHVERKVLPQVDVLELRVIIKHILLDIVSFAYVVLFVEILKVVLHKSV
jgi:hypothetical protein